MTPAKAERLLAVQRKLSAIEVKLGKKTQREMASLPEKYGYDGMESFISAYQDLDGGSNKALGESKRNQGKVAEDAIQEVLALAEAEKTVAVIAASVWLSVTTI